MLAAETLDSTDALGAGAAIFAVFMVILFSLLPLLLIGVGGIVGTIQENRHFDDLARREAAFAAMSVTDLKTLPPGMEVVSSIMVEGSVVIAADHFKTLSAKFRKFFGGEFQGLQRMQERGRREALMRMREKAQSLGATAVCNVRVETSTISGSRPNSVSGAEVIAYGTALVPAAG